MSGYDGKSDINEYILGRLFELRDEEYAKFQCKLMPTVDPKCVIGVRTPALRALAKEIFRIPAQNGALSPAMEFIRILPHEYYEQNNLHGFIVEQIKDFGQCTAAVDAFLPYVDNWATCDLMSPKIFAKHTTELLAHIDRWLASEKVYTVRFGVEMLMSFYLGENFRTEYAGRVAEVKSDEYYINMIIAWYFATALAKQWDCVIDFITQKRLAPWVHNKTIQKACESYRITEEQKQFLRRLKVQ